jgi:hypothetical protein
MAEYGCHRIAHGSASGKLYALTHPLCAVALQSPLAGLYLQEIEHDTPSEPLA